MTMWIRRMFAQASQPSRTTDKKQRKRQYFLYLGMTYNSPVFLKGPLMGRPCLCLDVSLRFMLLLNKTFGISTRSLHSHRFFDPKKCMYAFMCIHIRMHNHMHMLMHTHVHIQCENTHPYAHSCLCAYAYSYTCVKIYAYTYMQICVCKP